MVYTTENYLEGCTPKNVIPAYASLDEMAFHVLESVERDYNAIMMSVGVSELAHLEATGAEIVYEAGNGKVKELVDKATKLFKDMWEKVQGLIKKATDAFEAKATEFRKKIMTKVDSKVLADRVKNLKADKSFGNTYDYKNINEYSAEVIDKIKAVDSKVDKLYSEAVEGAKNGNVEKTNALDDALKAEVNGVIKALCPSADSAKNIIKFMKDDIRGGRKEVNGTWVKDNYKTIIEEVTNLPTTKKTLKKDYNELKKSYNDAIKACRKANDGKHFEANAYTKTIRAYKDLRQVTIYSQQAIIGCLNERYNFYRSVMFKLIGTKPVKESTVTESATVDRVSSLFEW